MQRVKRSDRSILGRYHLEIRYRGGPAPGTGSQSGTWYGRGQWPERITGVIWFPHGYTPEGLELPAFADYKDSGEYDTNGRRIYDHEGPTPPWTCPTCGHSVPYEQIAKGEKRP